MENELEIKYSFLDLSSIDEKLIEDFSCGNEEIDKRLKNADRGTTVVALDESKNTIVAFCTYAASGLTKTYDNHRITHPAVEIKCFAVDLNYQHKPLDEDYNYKISDDVLCRIIDRLHQISEKILYFDYIILYSVPDYISFYNRNGFESFKEFMLSDNYNFIDGCTPMFLSL